MAAALDQKDENKSLDLTCTLCKDRSKTLKLLPCQHSYCTLCLVQHHGEVDEEKPFCCPTCRTNLEIDVATVESLPDNYVHDIVKDAYGGTDSTEIKCISCNQVEKVTNATHKCLDCGDTLCQHCHEWHCRFSMSKHHIVVPIEDLKKGKVKEEFSKRKVLFCDLHSTDEKKIPLTSYCQECECLVCTKCIQSEHTGHQFTDPNVAREEKQASTNEGYTILQRSEKDQRKRISNIEHSITDTKQKWIKQEAEIYDKATEIFAIVDKIKDEKLAELKSHYEEELQHLNDLLEEERCKQSSLLSTVAFTSDFLEYSSNSDFLCHEKDIKNRMESRERKVHDYKRIDLSIEKHTIETLLPVLKSVFGRMVQTEKTVKHKCRIGKVSTLFSTSVDMLEIYGIAFNADTKELLLSGHCNHGSLLVVSDQGTFTKYITCENGQQSDDICVKDDEIYVTFYDKQRLTIIDVNKKIQRHIKLPDDDQEPSGFTPVVVDRAKTVFVGSSNTGRIYKMNPGEDKLSIFLCEEDHSNLKGVSHVRLTPSEQLVTSSTAPPSIQVFSKKGELQWEYNGENESNPLIKPSGICCDDDGNIYVSDNEMSRIRVIRDNELIGDISINEEVKEFVCVPLLLTPEGYLVYGYGNKLVKISFW